MTVRLKADTTTMGQLKLAPTYGNTPVDHTRSTSS
jgi:hypothetical protein